MKGVLTPHLISIDVDNFTSISVYSLVFVSIEKINYIRQLRQCFIGQSNTSIFFKNTPLHVKFSTLFSVVGYSNETLFLVFDILHPNTWYMTV